MSLEKYKNTQTAAAIHVHTAWEKPAYTHAHSERFVTTVHDWLGQRDPPSLLRRAKLNNASDNRVLISTAKRQELWVRSANSEIEELRWLSFWRHAPRLTQRWNTEQDAGWGKQRLGWGTRAGGRKRDKEERIGEINVFVRARLLAYKCLL